MSSNLQSNSTVKRTLRRKVEMPVLSDTEEAGSNRYQVYRGLSPDTSNRLEIKIISLEENLEAQKQTQLTLEQEIQMLVEELQQQNQLNEELNNKINQQMSTTKTKDQEFFRLKKEYEIVLDENEGKEGMMKKKFQDVITDLSDQLEVIKKQKNKGESERRKMMMEMTEVTSHMEASNALKRQMESKIENLEKEMKRTRTDNDVKAAQLTDINEGKGKLTQEKSELMLKLTNAETAADAVGRDKSKLLQEVESLKLALEDAESIRPQLMSTINGLQVDLQGLKNDLEDEGQAKQLLQSHVLKLQSDMNANKIQAEREMALQLQEAEAQRKKIISQKYEVENMLNLQMKRGAKLEKENARLNADIKELYDDLDLHKGQITELLKKLKSQETLNTEQRQHLEELTSALEVRGEKEERLQVEVNNLKHLLTSASDDSDKLLRQQKLDQEALKEMKNEEEETKRQLNVMTGLKNNSDKEIVRLTGKLGEMEGHMCEKENETHVVLNDLKVIKEELQSSALQHKEEINRLKRVQEKSAEENVRKLEEDQTRHKNEMTRLRKYFENELMSVQSSHDLLQRQHSDLNRSNKNLTNKIKEMEGVLGGLEVMVEDVRSQLAAVERRKSSLELHLDQVQNKLDTTEVSRRNLDVSLQEALQQNEHLSVQFTNLHGQLKRSEAELLSLTFVTQEFSTTKKDLEEMIEKQSNQVDQLNEALSYEVERSGESERVIREMEKKLREGRLVVEEMEGRMIKKERKMNAKIASKCQGIETELEGEQKKLKELSSENRKLSKQLQEVVMERDSERGEREEKDREVENAATVIAKLKKALVESEDVISLVTSKYKRLQHQFNENMADQEQSEPTFNRTNHNHSHTNQSHTNHSNHIPRATSHMSVLLPLTNSRLSISRSLKGGD